MKRILIIHPSRGRPEQAAKVYNNIVETCSRKHEIGYILSIDNDDNRAREYINLFSNKVTIVSNDSICNVEAMNCVYDKDMLSKFDIVFITTDDTYCPSNWDEELVKIFDEVGYDKILKTSNQENDTSEMLYLWIAGSQFFIDLGTFAWPEYLSVYADTDMSAYAKKHNKIIYARHLCFPHMHYNNKMTKSITDKYGETLKDDDTYRRQNRPIAYEIGAVIFQRRTEDGFPPYQK